MPELAEVEYFRKRWNSGLGEKLLRVEVHASARVFSGTDLALMQKALAGSRLRGSEARGKLLLFRFDQATLGLHLGMTGELRLEPAGFCPARHDHLALIQEKRTLVFADSRQFGRVIFQSGRADPDWWSTLPPDVLSKDFSRAALTAFLRRRKAAPVKSVLLMQERFPGVGNWMADEILWRAGLHPATPAGNVPDPGLLWKTIRSVCRDALRVIGTHWNDPPDEWLFPHRWKAGGTCPRCGGDLRRNPIGGRTTCWCPHCQRG